jgi:hypothetical protein
VRLQLGFFAEKVWPKVTPCPFATCKPTRIRICRFSGVWTDRTRLYGETDTGLKLGSQEGQCNGKIPAPPVSED